jgi:2-isopropylmalate synthase
MPVAMKEEFSYAVKDISDKAHKELGYDDIYKFFIRKYVENRAIFDIDECHFKQIAGGIEASVTTLHAGEKQLTVSHGNGRLDAVSNALKAFTGYSYTLTGYEQHALSDGSGARAISYVGVEHDGHIYWGAGIDEDIIKASYKALVSAVNNLYDAK